jgi:hypothetical protein
MRVGSFVLPFTRRCTGTRSDSGHSTFLLLFISESCFRFGTTVHPVSEFTGSGDSGTSFFNNGNDNNNDKHDNNNYNNNSYKGKQQQSTIETKKKYRRKHGDEIEVDIKAEI